MAFFKIRKCMLKSDMKFRPFYLFVTQFVCDLKFPLRNSVITPLKILIFQLPAVGFFGGGERQNH